ncbi:TonB-dependent receptor plug domain-containing protein [Porticoccaceae bacterium LTM1]|nr:TonB-dependent receptor plug domain-containing protein [Porticoccaceae bacterium LTM1]
MKISKYSFYHKKLVLSIAAVLSIGLVNASQDDAEKLNLDIKPQDAGSALMELASLSGVQIIVSEEAGYSVQVDALKGIFTLEQALKSLLSNTGLIYRYTSENVVLIKEDDEDEVGKEGSAKEDNIEEIVVTGSRLISDPGKMTKQMTILTREEIERSGVTRLDELLKRLPQNVNAPNNVGGGFVDDRYGLRDFGLGLNVFAGSSVNLRGLGSQYSLILIDGRRPASGGQFGGITDISNIPIDRVDRVEILFDGAAAIYGADAIGGVVNIVTNRAYEGTNVNLTYSDTTDGGSKRYNFSVGHTFSWESGSLTGNFSYQTQEDIDGSARDLALVASQGFSLPVSSPGTVGGNPIFGTNQRNAAMWVKDVDGDGRYDTQSLDERITGGVVAEGEFVFGTRRIPTTVELIRENPTMSSRIILDDPTIFPDLQANLPQDNGYIPVRVLQLPESDGTPFGLYDIDLTNYDGSVLGQEGVYADSAYVPRKGQSLAPEDKTYSIGIDLDQDLTESLTLALSMDYSTTEKRNNTRGNGDEFSIAGRATTHPFMTRVSYAWANEFPQQYQELLIDTYSLSGELDWQVNGDWEVVLGWGLGKTDQISDSYNKLYRDTFLAPAGTIALLDYLHGYYFENFSTRVPIEGVLIHDPFLGFNSSEELIAAAVNPRTHTVNKSFSRDMDFNIRGVLGQLPGGDVRTNIAISHRRNRNEVSSNDATYLLAATDVLGNTGDADIPYLREYEASYGETVNSVGFEVVAPLVGVENSKPFIQDFLISASARIEDYGNTDQRGENWSLGFNWHINNQFAVRFNRDYGLKVANAVRTATPMQGRDYCCFRLYTDETQDQFYGFQEVLHLTGGNNQLDPEIYDTNKLGFIFTPDSLEGLRVELSFIETGAQDRIGAPGVANYSTPDALEQLVDNPTTALYYATPEIVEEFQARALAGEYIGDTIDVGTLIKDARLFNVGSMRQKHADLQLTYNLSTNWGDWFVGWRYQYLHKQEYLQSDFCKRGDCFSGVGAERGPKPDNFNSWVDIVEVMDDDDFIGTSQIFQPVPKHSTALDLNWEYRGLGIGLRTDYRSDTTRIRRDSGWAIIDGQYTPLENVSEVTTSPTRSIDMTFSYDFSGSLFEVPSWMEGTRVSLTVDDVWRKEQEVTQKFIDKQFEPAVNQQFLRINGYAIEPRGRAFSLNINTTF